VTVLRRVAGTEDRGLGVRRVAQFAPGSLGSEWPDRELVVGDEVVALSGSPDPGMQGQEPLPYVQLAFDVVNGQARSRYSWFEALRGPFDEGAGPYDRSFPNAELEAALRAARHGRRR